jgi:putative ABC transport system substrate-binding protein
MRRREFIALISAVAAWPLTASAQQTTKIPRIGYLVTDVRKYQRLYDAFLERLRELGYMEGRNLVVEYRDAEGQLARFPDLAAELAVLTST